MKGTIDILSSMTCYMLCQRGGNTSMWVKSATWYHYPCISGVTGLHTASLQKCHLIVILLPDIGTSQSNPNTHTVLKWRVSSSTV